MIERICNAYCSFASMEVLRNFPACCLLVYLKLRKVNPLFGQLKQRIGKLQIMTSFILAVESKANLDGECFQAQETLTWSLI